MGIGHSSSFSQELRASVTDSWDLEKQHPFILGIGDGSLPFVNFRYYMLQDYIFLVDFCRVIAMAAAKARSISDMGWFAKLLHETLGTEMSLHIGFCSEFGITEEELKSTSPSPTTMAYTRHLIEVGFSGDAVQIATSILPCSWGYAEIGQMLHGNGLPENHPLYCRWIEMYSSPEFEALADWLRSFIDREANSTSEEGRLRMKQIFLNSSRYEYMFWDSAYNLEAWPI